MGYIENLNEIMSIKEQLKANLGLQSDDFAMYPELINKTVEDIALDYDMTKNYFTIEAIDQPNNFNGIANTLQFSITISSSLNTESLEYIAYSKNDGEFTVVPNVNGETVTITIDGLVKDDKIRICGKGNTLNGVNIKDFYVKYAQDSDAKNHLKFKFYGNIMSLLKENNFENTTITENNVFYGLFSEARASEYPYIYADQLVLPSNTTQGCYSYMFDECKNLMTAPQLPATTLAKNCYSNMFYNCWSLVNPPALPATELANSCYANMFYFCKSLAVVPKLHVTKFETSCCSSMFNTCTSLTYIDCFDDNMNIGETIISAPDNVFTSMFENCTSIVSIKDIKINNLSPGYSIFWKMFKGCTKLVNGPIIYVQSYYSNQVVGLAPLKEMFQGCTALKRFGLILNSVNDYSSMNLKQTSVSSYGTQIVNPLATGLSSSNTQADWSIGRYFITDNRICQYFDTYDDLLASVSLTNGYINTESLSMTNSDYNALFDTSALLATSVIKAQIYDNNTLTEQSLSYSASGEASVTVSLTAGQVVKLYAGTTSGNGEYWINAFSTADEGSSYLYTVQTTGNYIITTHAGTNKPYFTVTAA